MDRNFFSAEFSGDIFWYNESLQTVNTSAFEPFDQTRKREFDRPIHASNNMNKRVNEFLIRRFRNSETNGSEIELEKERCYRHMINERTRREKQKNSYSALHSILPIGTKNDKNSIVVVAAEKIRKLERMKERLSHRKIELEAVLNYNPKIGHNDEKNWTKVRVKMANPISGVDSMIEVLNCLKRLGLNCRNFSSVFAADEFLAELEIENKVKAAEIEETIQLKLDEAETKLPGHFWKAQMSNYD